MRGPQTARSPGSPEVPRSGVGISLTMNTVCEVCGNIGYKHLLVCCRDCKCSVVHLYCLDKVVFDASLAEWLCYECLQRCGEVTCSRSLEKEEIIHQLDYRASNELPHRSIGANLTQPFILRKKATDEVMPYSPNNGFEEVLSCAGFRNTLTVRGRSVDSNDLSSSSQHDTAESSESSKEFTECRKVSSCRRGKTIKMAAASSSCKSSEDIPSGNDSSESDNPQAPPRVDYILSYRSYLSEEQKGRVIAFIQEIHPEITVFVAVMQKRNVRPPGPFLGISMEYAFTHFPHKSTNITLQMPGKRKKWNPKFYKRNASRKNMLMGKWLDFVRDNHVQEGDICLLFPTERGKRSTFTVHLLCATASHSIGGAGSQRACPCPGTSSAKIDPGVHIMEKPTNDAYVSLKTDVHEISDESLESEDSGGPCQPPYIVPCRNSLSKSQKKIVEKRVRAIQSKVPICVAVMKNNNVGDAQKWMLELCVRYAAVHLPASGQTVVLQCMGKTWETQMVIHNGRRWFLNGGWSKFARDNGLRVGDICLFELKKNARRLTMKVHIISREPFGSK